MLHQEVKKRSFDEKFTQENHILHGQFSSVLDKLATQTPGCPTHANVTPACAVTWSYQASPVAGTLSVF